MGTASIWIVGSTGSGKTGRLVQELCNWVDSNSDPNTPPVNHHWTAAAESNPGTGRRGGRQKQDILISPTIPRSLRLGQDEPPLLVFAATGDDRIPLTDRIIHATSGRYPLDSSTPLAFFQREVLLFWPLLIQQLHLRAEFPLRVRPETEQELATRLWRDELDSGRLRQEGVSEYRLVRRTLDLLQLAASSGRRLEDIPVILQEGIDDPSGDLDLWDCMGEVLLKWRRWCLQRGLLTYGIITELYWRHLLPNPTYRSHLIRRYPAVFADDVDEYPKIVRDLFEVLLDGGIPGVFTYNPKGSVRQGLGADPDYLAGLAFRCEQQQLRVTSGLAGTLGKMALQVMEDPTVYLEEMEESGLSLPVGSIQTTARSQLLRETGEAIAHAVHTAKVKPSEIAVIAPGLDAIARYTLQSILTSKGIPVQSLNEQRPLATVPVIRALLTLLALVYPGLGRLVDRDSVAEMLVVLSRRPNWESLKETEEGTNLLHPASFLIDPVRAGLLVDHCYSPATEQPKLLPVTAFPRWDRLGYRATTVYQEILDWIDKRRSQLTSPIALLNSAIQEFLGRSSSLPGDQIAALRELMETAQHYWEVDGRLRRCGEQDAPDYVTVGQFIQLLRKGTITANPFPVSALGAKPNSVTLATIFQYRAARQFHRWHFWLDIGSPLWSRGGAASLFAAPLFLQSWSGDPWTQEEEIRNDEDRLQRIVLDLLGRVGDRVILCHSDLATNGQEQTGPLLSVLNAWVPLAE
ncbi:recombinase family protein [Laspinema olomoucense]|uniref:recombinase family protein n=1 Tax=Laspinema olomoucense TaxID=3231600 RepID=UPI0021BA914A|nr:recombinase family protein [Laspinema sp. D3c]MCT7994187.1 recombinase family protein [Laspinema sp. D3c]